jgi:hypothetical protein
VTLGFAQAFVAVALLLVGRDLFRCPGLPDGDDFEGEWEMDVTDGRRG